MKDRILVTGANGFVGRELTKVLDCAGYNVIPMVQEPMGHPQEVIADFCDNNFTQVLKALPKVDIVVHLGAHVGWDGSSREKLFKPNVFATAELVQCAKIHSSYFVFASAAIVCGVRNEYISSDSMPNPDTDYGYSKWIAEELIRMSGIQNVVLRIAGIFGKDGPQHLGINKAISTVLHGNTPIQYGSGNNKRNYIYVKDLCSHIQYCIKERITGTLNVAGSEHNSVSEMLAIICAELMPGIKPICCDGKQGLDQIVEHSSKLKKGRLFLEAIQDIKKQ